MPIYSFQGKKYKLSETDPEKALDLLMSLSEEPPEPTEAPKEKTNFLEDIGSGLRNAAEMGLEGLGMAAAGSLSMPGPVGLLGKAQDALLGTDTREAIFDAVKGSREARNARESSVDRGEVGKVLQAVGAIPAYLNPMTAGAAIAGGGVNTALTMLDQGSDVPHALAGQAADTALSAAGMKVGDMFNVAKPLVNAALQGGINVAQEAAVSHPVENVIRRSAGIQERPDMTPGDYAAAFVPGAAIGAMTAKSHTPSKPTEEAPQSDISFSPTEANQRYLDSLRGNQNSIVSRMNFLEKEISTFPKDSMSEAQYNLYKEKMDEYSELGKQLLETDDRIKEYESIIKPEVEIQNIKAEDLGVAENPTAKQVEPVKDTYESLTETPIVERPLDPNKPALLQGGTPEEKSALFQRPIRPEQQAALLSGEPLPKVTADTAPAMGTDVPALMRSFVKPPVETPTPQRAALFGGKEIPPETPTPLDPNKPALFQSQIPDARKPVVPSSNTPALFRGAPEHLVDPKSAENEIPPPEVKNTSVSSTSTTVKAPLPVEEKQQTARTLSKSMNDPLYNIDVSNKLTAAQVVDQLKAKEGIVDRAYRIGREVFGSQQFVEAIKREAPVIWETYKRIKTVNEAVTSMKYRWLYGDIPVDKSTGGPLMTLAHQEAMDSIMAVKAALTPAEKERVLSQLEKTFNARQEHTSVDLSHLTPKEQQAVRTIEDMYRRVREDFGLKKRNGYMHTSRKGDFAVGIKTTLGDVTHVEFLPSKKDAVEWLKRASEKGFNTTDVLDLKSEKGMKFAEAFDVIKEVLDEVNLGHPTKETMEHMEALQDFLATNAKGMHNLAKAGYTGGVGSKLFKSKRQNAIEWFDSFENYAQEMATQKKKILLNKESNDFFEGPEGSALKKMVPNQVETSKYLMDIAMNNQQKYGVAEQIDNIKKEVDNLLVSAVRTGIGAAKSVPYFGKKITADEKLWYPDVPITDKTTGMAAELFYIRTLTSRPAFWAGQVLSSPFAMRQFLKEGSVLDTMKAQGKGLASFMSGGDAEFRAFVRDIASTSETLIPQLHTEINEVPIFGRHGNPKLSKIYEMMTGKTPAAMADTMSRYMTLSIAYHFYKDMGMKGQQLKANVQQAVDNTMVVYSRAYTPPFLTKSGFAGQHIAPLQKYGLAQLQHLIGDFKHIKDQKTLRSTLPMISTLMTTMIMSGSIGLPLLMEYEILRIAAVKAGEFFGLNAEEYLPPSVMEMMLTNNRVKDAFVAGLGTVGISEDTAKKTMTHGVVSAATGMDIGSSLRFNPFVPEPGEQISLMNAFPIVKSVLETGAHAATKIKGRVGGDTTLAEQRKADLFFGGHVVGGKAAVDELKYDAGTRPTVPGGNRSFAQVEQTEQERLATLLGTSTVDTKIAKAGEKILRGKDKEETAKKQRVVDLILDGVRTGNEEQVSRNVEKALKLNMDMKDIERLLESAERKRTTPSLMQRFTNAKGQVSTKKQQREYMEQEKYK